MTAQRVVDNLRNMVAQMIDDKAPTMGWAVFVGEEAVDSDLSIVTYEGRTYRYVPKVGDPGGAPTYTTNDNVLVVMGGGLPMIILAKLYGDVALATDE